MAIPNNMNLGSQTNAMAQEYNPYSEYPTKDYKYDVEQDHSKDSL